MSEYIIPGLPSSPSINDERERHTLRDQFAMAALTGVLSSLNPPSQAGKICYEYADQMLAAR